LKKKRKKKKIGLFDNIIGGDYDFYPGILNEYSQKMSVGEKKSNTHRRSKDLFVLFCFVFFFNSVVPSSSCEIYETGLYPPPPGRGKREAGDNEIIATWDQTHFYSFRESEELGDNADLIGVFFFLFFFTASD
jgi:hypothetical protein